MTNAARVKYPAALQRCKLDTPLLAAGSLIEMASDGSLSEIYGDCSECHKWMGKWIRESMELEAENNPYHAYLAFVVEEKGSGRAIGSVGTSYYEDMQRIGITYFIGADFRGHGYMAEAVRAFAEYFFQNYDAIRSLPLRQSGTKLAAGQWSGRVLCYLTQEIIRICTMIRRNCLISMN